MFKKLFGGSAQHIASIKPWGAELAVSSNQTLLEAALASNLPFPHNCTVGTCGSCKCRLVSGRVSAITDFGYTLSGEELSAGYILACQARLKSPVEIEVELAGEHLPPPEIFSGQITKTEALTHDILSVTVQLDRPMKYVAGQYANLTIPGLAARAYSFSAGPERAGRQQLNFFIRKTPGGAFTEPLFAGALNGTPFTVNGPHGNFWLRGGAGPIICIAGGSGLAPVLSLLHDARKNRHRRDCVMLFGARTQADLYALDQLADIQSTWPDKFSLHPILSHEAAESGWQGQRGFVTEALASHITPATAAATQAYVCGPPPMIDAAITTLVGLDVPLSSIHYDKFTDSSHASQ